MKLIKVFSLIPLLLFLCSCSSTGRLDVGRLTSLYERGKRFVGAVEGLTPEQEYYLGRGVAANILQKYPAYGSPKSRLNRYLNQVGQSLVAYSDLPYTYNGYHFMVVRSDEINAFATPGGFIFVTTGLLREIPDEDALAAVLAHEIAHVVLEHGVSAVETSIITDVVTTTGLEVAEQQSGDTTRMILSNTKNFGIAIDDIAQTLLVNGYSRSQEYSADEYAANLLARAGYNPSGLTVMLKSIEKVEIAHRAAGKSAAGFMSTHPSASNRLDEVEDISVVSDAGPGDDTGQAARRNRFQSSVGNLG